MVLNPRPPVPPPKARWTPPPIPIAKSVPAHCSAYRRLRQITILMRRRGHGPHSNSASRPMGEWPAILVPGTHRVSLIPSFPGVQTLRGGQHATNRSRLAAHEGVRCVGWNPIGPQPTEC